MKTNTVLATDEKTQRSERVDESGWRRDTLPAEGTIAREKQVEPKPIPLWARVSRFAVAAFRASSVRECYDRSARFYDDIFGENQLFYSRMLVWLLSQRYGSSFQNALDLGAGTGILTRKLKLVAAEVCGMDFSRAMLEQAVFEGGPSNGIRYVSGNALALPFPGKQFDLITSLGMMTHILPRDFERFVLEIARVAAGSAVVVIAMPPLPWRLFFARHPSFEPTAVDKALTVSYNLLQKALRLDERRGVYDPAIFSEAFSQYGFVVEEQVIENLSVIIASRGI